MRSRPLPRWLLMWWFWAAGLLVAAAGWAPTARAQHDSGEYRILEARYGTEERNVDVTPRLRELARSDQPIRVANEVMGTDPDFGRVKTLRIYARHTGNGRMRTFEFGEGSTVDGALFIGWRGGEWGDGRSDGRGNGWGKPGYHDGDDGDYRIVRALYGTAERHADVTPRLRELARADQRFRLGNDTFSGLDPDYGRVKTLRIFATGPNGRQRTFEYTEGSTVDGAQFQGWGRGAWGQPAPGTLPAWNGWPDQPGRGLVIVSALYGSGPQVVDVSARVRERILDGRVSFTASNQSAGHDPAPGVVKTLTVTYRIDGGREQRRVVNEGQVLTLP